MGKASNRKRTTLRAERIAKREKPSGLFHANDVAYHQRGLTMAFQRMQAMGQFATVEEFVVAREKAMKTMFKQALRRQGMLNKYSAGMNAVDGTKNPKYVDLNMLIAASKAKVLAEAEAKAKAEAEGASASDDVQPETTGE